MADDDGYIGADRLVDGMRISLRMRRDFVVTDAARFLAAGRRAFMDLHPDVTEETAAEHVWCAADAVYAVLERDGFMSEQDADGLAGRGGRQQLTFNDPAPLSYPPNCFEGDLDVFKPSSDPTDHLG